MPERRRHIVLFTTVQSTCFLVMIFVMCLESGITTFGIKPHQSTVSETLTLRGIANVSYSSSPNPWYGPSLASLVSHGALYPPCMRTDYRYNMGIAKVMSLNETLGCCEQPLINVAVTTTKEECLSLITSNSTDHWKSVRCSNRPIGENFVSHVIRPCCSYIENKCLMASPHHCWLIQGQFHYHADHCSQVDCLHSFCRNIKTLDVNDYQRLDGLPANHEQWWRVVSSLYTTHGIIDGLLFVLLFFPFGFLLEMEIGTVRMALIYYTAGVGGNMIGALFVSSTSITAGIGPCVAGVMGSSIISHIRDWKLVTKPLSPLFSRLFVLCIILGLGTLPRLNVFAITGGLVLGFLSAFIHLSFSNVVKYSSCLTTVVIMLVVLFLFYEVQAHSHWGQQLPCNLYTAQWCNR